MLSGKQRERLSLCIFVILIAFFSAQISLLDPKYDVYCYEYEDTAKDYCSPDYAVVAILKNTSIIAHTYTEDIIATFTAILGIATWFLWWSTRALAKSADATSYAQLRAYVFNKLWIKPNIVKDSIGRDTVLEYIFYADINNIGLTPALSVQTWLEIQIFPIMENREPWFEKVRDAPP